MKKFIILLFVVMGLTSCSSCATTKEPTTPDGSVDASGRETVVGDGWSFRLPSPGWKLSPKTDSGPPFNLYVNDSVKNMILFAKEPFTGTLQQYMLLAMRGVKDSGGTVVDLSQLAIINDVNFVSLEVSASSGKLIWTWVAVKNGWAYSLVCSGTVSSDDTQRTLCEQVAHTIQIN